MEMKLTQALSETNDLSFVKEENVKITTELERLKEMEEIYHTLTIQSAHAEKEKTEAQTKVRRTLMTLSSSTTLVWASVFSFSA
jgi:hypothetical protein